ncbi:hypothetical protein [Halococcus hamelinensis]|uniref:Uncharacterized protein n=1 Tax=Halococcus hamelinensis 100A6 TaxID=1132509 RepID=M0M221_9EURY|nr:hypothetical protein [Halococcus hamelinensis]EMA38634.1 hypothetical protein C447_08855 [Halococcus hamelinensis 100A6]
MVDPDETPDLPTERLEAGGWAHAETTTETLFGLSTIRVVGTTVLYEDGELRARLREATDGDLDAPWRFFFATQLDFRPPLAPGIGPAAILPTVTMEARRTFTSDLRDRGFRNVDRGRTQRTRTRSGERLRLTKYTARYAVEWKERYDLDIEGWIGVWVRRGTFRLAGGAYPTRGFDELLAAVDEEAPTDPREYRGDLLDLVRAVE